MNNKQFSESGKVVGQTTSTGVLMTIKHKTSYSVNDEKEMNSYE